MNFFEQQDGKLIFRENGETVLVEAWGADSLRVRSCMLGDIRDTNAALMNFFEQQDGKLIFRENGETVLVEAWGADSLRVRSCMLGDIRDTNAALLEPEKTDAVIEVSDMEASISNGKIKAHLRAQLHAGRYSRHECGAFGAGKNRCSN